jgi:hypothetical protein
VAERLEAPRERARSAAGDVVGFRPIDTLSICKYLKLQDGQIAAGNQNAAFGKPMISRYFQKAIHRKPLPFAQIRNHHYISRHFPASVLAQKASGPLGCSRSEFRSTQPGLSLDLDEIGILPVTTRTISRGFGTALEGFGLCDARRGLERRQPMRIQNRGIPPTGSWRPIRFDR